MLNSIINWWQGTALYASWEQTIHPFAGFTMSPTMMMLFDHMKAELLLGLIMVLILVPGAVYRMSNGSDNNRKNNNFNIFNLF